MLTAGVWCVSLCLCLCERGKTHLFYLCPSSSSSSSVLSLHIFQLSPFLPALSLLSLFPPPPVSFALIPPPHPQPQVEPVLEGEEVHAQAVGEGEEAFREEYVTGDVTPKEYDYSYRDYPEPPVETGDMDGSMGPALPAVTHQGGVSCFAC